MYVTCNVCSGTIVDGEEQPLLRRFPVPDDGERTFNTAHFVDVISSQINEVEIHIKLSYEDSATFFNNPRGDVGEEYVLSTPLRVVRGD